MRKTSLLLTALLACSSLSAKPLPAGSLSPDNLGVTLAGREIHASALRDRDGTIADVHVGYDESELDSLVAEINALMSEPAPAGSVIGATGPGSVRTSTH
ncbi:MAG: hypothetical protein ACREP0_06690 [Rhodanobacteraceae bacterium]